MNPTVEEISPPAERWFRLIVGESDLRRLHFLLSNDDTSPDPLWDVIYAALQ